jgi:hypothetical protein
MQVHYWLVALVSLAFSTTSLADAIPCGGTTIVASGWTAAEAKHVCASVRTALDWLHTLGISLSHALVLRPLDDRANADRVHALGQYDSQTKTIHLLPFDAALRASRERAAACGVPMSRQMWGSYVAHETAHAAIEEHFASGCARQTASEYIAAVTQLKSLPPAARDLILAAHEALPAWRSESEITSLYYFLDPCGFAVKSFRHFVSLPDDEQRTFVQRLLRVGLPN